MRTLTALAFLAGLVLAPAAGAAVNSVDSTFKKDCSPYDQPALKLVIPYEGRSFEISIWGERLENLASQQMLVVNNADDDQQTGRANSNLFICTAERCDASNAQLRIGQYRPADFLDGDLIWFNGDGMPVSIRFNAKYVDVQSPCEP